MRRLLCCAVLVSLLATATVADARSTRAQRVAAANAFADRTVELDRKRRAAQKQSDAAVDARRSSAHACFAVWQSAPARLRDSLGIIYVTYLNAGAWSVQAPMFGSWIADLRASKRIDRSPLLARAADALRRDHAFARSFYQAFPDACVTIMTWRDAGWQDAARPAGFAPIDIVVRGGVPREYGLVDSASRQLRRYARAGDRAARILNFGVDVADYRMRSTICDPLADLLFPDDRSCR